MSFLLRRLVLGTKSLVPASAHLQTGFRHFHLASVFWLPKKLVSFNLADIGEGIKDVVVKEWFVKEGDTVSQFDNICEVQSDKASVTITSRFDGKVAKLYHKVDDIALVGKPLVDFEVEEEGEKEEETSSSSDSSSGDEAVVEELESVQNSVRVKVLATPAVRRIAMENKLDLSEVTPTGRNGRVLKGDVLQHLKLIPDDTMVPHPTILAKQATSTPSPATQNLQETIQPLKGVARAMFKTMTDTLKIPHFAYGDEINVTQLVRLREELKDEAAAQGIKLTYMPFFIKAASLALRQYPILNATVDEERVAVVLKPRHNISVAIDSPQGLVVPNIKDVQAKSIAEVARELNALIERAQQGTLAPDDFAHGTFSLSNIGNAGGVGPFHPCIFPPQVAIGAIGRAVAVPRFGAGDEVIKVHLLNVSWCADHRVIDGMTMANFSNRWKRFLENPNLLLLNAH